MSKLLSPGFRHYHHPRFSTPWGLPSGSGTRNGGSTLNKRLRLLLVLALLGLALCFLPSAELLAERFGLARAEVSQRTTPFPASLVPDQVCLTWSSDPTATQTVQWRTAPAVTEGLFQCRAAGDNAGPVIEIMAESRLLEDPLLTNDPVNRRFTVTCAGLAPATTYAYRVGDPAADVWSGWAEFTTAPSGAGPFSFIYLGDAQLGFEEWGRLLRRAAAHRPDAAFYVMAGDLVNRGNDRDDWDAFFQAAHGVFDHRPVVPAIGNHEYTKEGNPRLYLDVFALPKEGPENVPSERAYSFQYRNALFVVLDSNLPPETQRPWLEHQLAATNAVWKFVIFHHPPYSSAPRRDNPEIRESWCGLFDRYHVDMVLTGHDHAYLRTHPMREQRPVASAAEGTYYVVANSGMKHYEQETRDYAAVAFTKTSTYQVIDIQTEGGDKLTYRAYDVNGNMRDEVIIEKN